MTERISSGVEGLDPLIGGGLVKSSTVLIAGKSGTLKTAFCMSYLYEGCKKGEAGVYVSTEESEADIIEDAKEMFGWDLGQMKGKGLLRFISHVPPYTGKDVVDLEKLIKAYVNDLISSILALAEEIKAKRIVIDSISMVEMFIQNRYLSRLAIMSILKSLKNLGATTVVTEGVPEKSILMGDEAMVEFIVDAVIKLDFVPVAETHTRTLTVTKMRRTKHSPLIHPFNLEKEGLKVIEIRR